MSNSYVKLSNVYADYIMEWFYSTICQSGGDGAAVICCGNPEETADFFVVWWKKHYLPTMKLGGYKISEFWHPRDTYVTQKNETVVNYHDMNENFMFSNGIIDLDFGDVNFIVEEDCTSWNGAFTIKAVR